MTKSLDFDPSCLAEACGLGLSQKKPKIAIIAREFRVSRTNLRIRVKKAKPHITRTKPHRNTLQPHQEKTLTNSIVQMYGWNLPPTAGLIQAQENRALARTSQDRQVNKMWAYRFQARLPKHINLAPVRQKTKELRGIQAEDAGRLQNWYELLENQLQGVPVR